jgi:hypothetical protein
MIILPFPLKKKRDRRFQSTNAIIIIPMKITNEMIIIPCMPIYHQPMRASNERPVRDIYPHIPFSSRYKSTTTGCRQSHMDDLLVTLLHNLAQHPETGTGTCRRLAVVTLYCSVQW